MIPTVEYIKRRIRLEYRRDPITTISAVLAIITLTIMASTT